jgi:hypothetical protein
MVFLKVNQEIMDLRKEVGLKKLVGCHPNCAVQVISYDDLSLLVDCYNLRAEKKGEKKLVLLEIIDRTCLAYWIGDHMCVNILKDEVKPHEIVQTVAEEKQKEAARPKTDKEMAEEEAH